MPTVPIQSIAVFGNGLAGLLCVAKLVKILPKAIELTYVEALKPGETDVFFGTISSSTTYEFFLGLGLSEPELLLSTNTSFSLGTQYTNWGSSDHSWTQSFHRPLPMFNGVGFHHYLTRLKQTAPELSDFEPYIMAVQAANKGVFAHPPEGQKIPLADVEYGYHFLPSAWCDFLTTQLRGQSVNWVKSDVVTVDREEGSIRSVSLTNGQTLSADFMIDALGPNSKLKAEDQTFQASGRRLKVASLFKESPNPDGVQRVLIGADFGWQAQTPLQNGVHHQIIFDPLSTPETLDQQDTASPSTYEAELGRLESPWTKNCLSLGHSAATVEPLTPAPIMLLQRDIERLAELIPVTSNMVVESREYNRRFQSDYEHAELFEKGFFKTEESYDTPYWKAASQMPTPAKLNEKIKQFESRGVSVQYDYEPFTVQDWTQQHFGMERNPHRYDPLADHMPISQLKQKLTQMRTAVSVMASKMPPHPVYMTGLLKYLKEKHG